jgi:hypothetical protein
MKATARILSSTYAAGTFGGLVNGLVVWFCGVAGITAALGVKIAPALTAAFLYPKLVWGGLWGFIFLLPPFRKYSTVVRGILASLGPTLAQLLYFFPYVQGKGMFGMDLGLMTPVLVFVFNAVWGICAAFWLSRTDQ